MKHPVLTKVLTFFIAAQFLNVQIQTAYGTEAVTHANPETVQALKQMEAKVQSRIENLSERAQLKYAYRLYKVDVKLRNRTFHKTDEEIQQRIEALDQGKVTQQSEAPSAEDQELAQELNANQAFSDLAGAHQIKVSFNRSQVKKEKLLENADPLLIDLGSEINDDGSFTKASFQTFQNKVFELNKVDSRAPASMNVIVKILLSLLIVAAGLAILYVVLVVYVLSMIFGGTLTTGGAALLILLSLGAVAGMIFGLRAVITAQINEDKFPLIPSTPLLS